MLQAKIINAIQGGLNNKDSDFQAGITSIINEGVVSGLEVSATEISTGSAFILATRTNITPNENWLVYVKLTEAYGLNTIGNNKKVYIELRQSNLNDITLNTRPMGDDIAEIKVDDAFPTSNYIALAETDGSGVVTDLRESISLKNELVQASTFQISELRGGNWKVVYTNGQGRGEELSLGTNGQVLTSAGASNAPIWTSPSIDINALTEDTVGDMDLDFTQRFNGTNNRKIKINRYRASDAEATAGTSTKKFITPKQAKDRYFDGQFVSQGIASDIIQGESLSEVTISTTTPTKRKEATISTNLPGTARLKFEGRSTSGNVANARLAVYKNGVSVTNFTVTTSYQEFTFDISYTEGDLLQVYAWATDGGGMAVRNFRVCFTITRKPYTQILL